MDHLFNKLSFISISDWAAIVQVIISLLTAALLVVTMRLQKNANKQQKELFEMDLKAKRGEYLPILEIKLLVVDDEEYIREAMARGEGGLDQNGWPKSLADGDKVLRCHIRVLENSFTEVTVDFDNPSPEIMTPADDIVINKAVYKKGDVLNVSILKFKFAAWELTKNMGHVLSTVGSIRFEDTIGNRYVQHAIYTFNDEGAEIFPMLSVEKA